MRGFVYVLVNSSLPGLVKVGKTTRLPSERVQELSGATGVPTPFIVAFEKAFNDCHAAERFVHSKLEAMGLRQAANREFFRANTAEVIQIVLEASEAFHANPPASSSTRASDEPDELDDMVLDSEPGTIPWTDLLNEGYDHLYGLGDKLEDVVEARLLFEGAAKLGSGEAEYQLGQLYQNGQGVREDLARSLEHYKRAIRLKHYAAYGSMAQLFALRGQYENYVKCAERLVDVWNKAEGSAHLSSTDYDKALFLIMVMAGALSKPFPIEDELRARAPQLIDRFVQQAEFEARAAPTEFAEQIRFQNESAITWLQSSCAPPEQQA